MLTCVIASPRLNGSSSTPGGVEDRWLADCSSVEELVARNTVGSPSFMQFHEFELIGAEHGCSF